MWSIQVYILFSVCSLHQWSSDCTHHIMNSEKEAGNNGAYYCRKCSSYYSTKQQVQAHHRNVHKGRRFPCNECEKQRKVHMLSHSTNKPLKCDQCEYRCHRQVDLREHKERHLGLNKFQCTECPAVYTSQHMLNAHKNKHRGKEKFKPIWYINLWWPLGPGLKKIQKVCQIDEYWSQNVFRTSFFSPPVQIIIAWWAHMHHFLSVCPSGLDQK